MKNNRPFTVSPGRQLTVARSSSRDNDIFQIKVRSFSFMNIIKTVEDWFLSLGICRSPLVEDFTLKAAALKEIPHRSHKTSLCQTWKQKKLKTSLCPVFLHVCEFQYDSYLTRANQQFYFSLCTQYHSFLSILHFCGRLAVFSKHITVQLLMCNLGSQSIVNILNTVCKSHRCTFNNVYLWHHCYDFVSFSGIIVTIGWHHFSSLMTSPC